MVIGLWLTGTGKMRPTIRVVLYRPVGLDQLLEGEKPI